MSKRIVSQILQKRSNLAKSLQPCYGNSNNNVHKVPSHLTAATRSSFSSLSKRSTILQTCNFNNNHGYYNNLLLTSFTNRFSTHEATKESEATAPEEAWIPEQFTRERPPSILTKTFPDSSYTTGQAWSIVQQNIGGGNQIRHSDFESICNSTQSQYPKDAKLLTRILVDLRKYNRFILTKDLASTCVNGMFRSLLPKGCGSIFDEKVKGYFKVQCGLAIGESFLEKDTGLYVALDTDDVNEKVLEPLYYGLKDLQQNLVDHQSDDVKASATIASENDDRDSEDQDDVEGGGERESSSSSSSRKEKYVKTANDLLSKSINLSKDVFDTLLRRASNPTRDMKKRAKRKYLRYSRCCNGPSPTTIDLLVKICLLEVHQRALNGGDLKTNLVQDESDGEEEEEETKIDGLAMAKLIVNNFEEREFLGSVRSDTHALIQEVENMLLKASEETAAGEAEPDEVESEENSEDENDGGKGGEANQEKK